MLHFDLLNSLKGVRERDASVDLRACAKAWEGKGKKNYKRYSCWPLWSGDKVLKSDIMLSAEGWMRVSPLKFTVVISFEVSTTGFHS